MDDRLGSLVSVHPVAGRRRWVRVGAALVCAVGGVLVLAALIGGVKVPSRLPTVALILVAAGLPIVWFQVVGAIRGGPRESFELHEHGLVHHAWNVRSWTWQQVATVQVGSALQDIHRLDLLRCSVRFTDGKKVRIDGLTSDGMALVDTLRSLCPAAVRYADQDPFRRVWLFAVPTIFAACVGIGIYLVYYINNNDGREVEIGDDVWTTTYLSDTAGAIILVIVIACFIGAVFSLVAFLNLLTEWHDRPGWQDRR